MAARGRRFSFLRLMNNSFPNFAHDDPNDVDLKPDRADLLLVYQLTLPHPRYLGEQAFLHAGTVESASYSRKTYKALIKHNFILPPPAPSPPSPSFTPPTLPDTTSPSSPPPISPSPPAQMTVNTTIITRAFASQLAHLSVHAQRRLIGLLFFWEEECTRWKLLDAEERDLRSELAHYPGNRDLELALAAVEMRRRLVPSQRAEGTTAGASLGAGHALPSYS